MKQTSSYNIAGDLKPLRSGASSTAVMPAAPVGADQQRTKCEEEAFSDFCFLFVRYCPSGGGAVHLAIQKERIRRHCIRCSARGTRAPVKRIARARRTNKAETI